MRLYSEEDNYKLYQGSMLDMLEVIDPGSIDAIITDPPYELNFMGKGWDNSGIAFQKETWRKCYEVLKDGGYLLAFGGSRTFHRIACAIEDAGFEIRDVIMWLYGSGFPKSMNIGLAIDKKNGVESKVVGTGKSGDAQTHTRCMASITKKGNSVFGGEYEIKQAQNEWGGWGTALKPSYEPIIVARKPFKGSLVDNILKNGVGGLNIDECRVGDEVISIHNAPKGTFAGGEYDRGSDTSSYRESLGRFPANTILTYDDSDFDEVCKNMADSSRYFYCAKASKKDRDEGLEEFETKSHAEINGRKEGSKGATREYGGGTNPFLSVSCPRKNTHPTVKPVELMQYLIRLVCPQGSVILDCFNGSGSTGKAVMYENRERDKDYKYIGIELTEEYLPIADARIKFAQGTEKQTRLF